MDVMLFFAGVFASAALGTYLINKLAGIMPDDWKRRERKQRKAYEKSMRERYNRKNKLLFPKEGEDGTA